MQSIRRREALKLGVACALGGCSHAPAPRDLGSSSAHPLAVPRPPVISAEVTAPSDVFTLAFGSCNRPSLPQPLWNDVRALAPDAWAWLGDIVYADTVDIARTRENGSAVATRVP